MNPNRVSIRFEANDAPIRLEPAVATFHRFIQRGLVEGLLVDVADYRHVPEGPGVVLVGHDVDHGLRHDGLVVTRKRAVDVELVEATRDALRMGLGTIDAIADDPDLDAGFDRSQFTVSAVDRRLGDPDDVVGVLHDTVQRLLAELAGADGATVTAVPVAPRTSASVQVELSAAAASGLLDALGGSRVPGQSPWDITPEQFARIRDEQPDVVVIDVREPTEYEIVHLGGRLLPLATLEDHLDELDRDAHTVVHCRAGHRGARATTLLRDAGFTDVWNVNGGLMAWIDRVDPSLPRY